MWWRNVDVRISSYRRIFKWYSLLRMSLCEHRGNQESVSFSNESALCENIKLQNRHILEWHLLLRISLCEHTGTPESISFAFERVKLILKTRTDSDACVKLDLFPAVSLNTGTQALVLQSYSCSATIIQMSVLHVSRDFVLQCVAVCCSVLQCQLYNHPDVCVSCTTVSTEIATPPQSTKSRNSYFLVSPASNSTQSVI